MRRRELLAAAALTPLGAAAARAAAPGLAWLLGKWRGEGMLMGAPGTAELDARLALADRFLAIDWRTQGIGEKDRFEGHGLYRLAGAPMPGKWFDSTGAIRTLTARIAGQALHVDWGTAETERGRSVYSVTGTVLTVEDSVVAAATGPRVFATHRLHRAG